MWSDSATDSAKYKIHSGKSEKKTIFLNILCTKTLGPEYFKLKFQRAWAHKVIIFLAIP